MSGTPALELVCVRKEYALGDTRVVAVDDVTFTVPRGEFTAIVGPSGSGKSTLLHLVAGIDTVTSGTIRLDGVELSTLDDDARTIQRRDRIGMVQQFFHLLPTLSARENVALPALLAGRPERATLAAADRLLERVGLAARREARPHTLSGGEMQRVALARALLAEPALVLADEPTGNLDSRAADQVLELLHELAGRVGATVLLVTHSADAAARAARVITLRDGRIVADARRA